MYQKRGFTMVELLAVIAILAIIILIAVPTFGGVKERTNQSVYESKIASVKAASEAYSEESGKMVFDIRTLISEGKLEADNESGEYLNPVNGEDMRCYIVNVRYENLQYYANVHESSECLDEAELEAIYGAVKVIAYNKDKTDKVEPYHQNWYNEPIIISYELSETANYTSSNIERISWQGDRSITCTKEAGDLENCRYYGTESLGSAGTITNMNVSLEITFKNDQGIEFNSKTSRVISIDMESPRVVMVTPGLGLTNQSGKRVDIEMTDGNGSGLLEYKMVKVESEASPLPMCKDLDGYKQVTQNKMSEYKDNGIYYTCVRDNVGNDNQGTLEYSKTIVSGVDYSKVDGVVFTVSSTGDSTPMKVHATVTVPSGEDTSKLKMCVSNQGFLSNCSWEPYRSEFDWELEGNADCNSRTVYLSIADEAGNITNLVSNEYTPVDIAKYEANGGSLTSSGDARKTVCYNGTYPMPNVTREGHSFDGWYTEANGGEKITNTTQVNYNGVKTLYAHWKINSYTLSYNLDNGAYGSSHPTTAKYNEQITIHNPSRTGYTFAGWNISGMDSITHTYGSATTNATTLNGRKETTYKNLRGTSGVVTFKATWTINTYNVSWNGNGGSVTKNGATRVNYNNNVGTLGQASRTGYSLDGWYTQASGGSKISTTTKVTGNVTYYAHWIPNNYYLDLNGLLDGKSSGNISGYGTADVYVNNKLVCDNCSDYYTQHPYGSTYEIKDIKALNGFAYQGVSSGAIKGTIGAGNVGVQLKFATTYKTPGSLKVGDVIYYILPDNFSEYRRDDIDDDNRIKMVVMEVSGGTAKVVPVNTEVYNAKLSNIWKLTDDILAKCRDYRNNAMASDVQTLGSGQGNDPYYEYHGSRDREEATSYIGKKSLAQAQTNQLIALKNKGFNKIFKPSYYASCTETERHSCSGNYTITADRNAIGEGVIVAYGTDWMRAGSADNSVNGATIGLAAPWGFGERTINYSTGSSDLDYYELLTALVPIITLRSDLKFKEGNGTLASPYATYTAADSQKYNNMLATIKQKAKEAAVANYIKKDYTYRYTDKYITVNGLINKGYLDASYKVDPRGIDSSFGCNVVNVWLRGYSKELTVDKVGGGILNGQKNCSTVKWSSHEDAS